MKKVILALAIVSVSFAACNNADKKEETTETKDTSTVVAPKTPDTMTVVKDTMVKTTIDTLKKK